MHSRTPFCRGHIGRARCAHERVNGDVFRHFPQIPTEYLSNGQIAEENWRSRIERANPGRFQRERSTRNGTVQHGWVFQTDKISHWPPPRGRRFQLDVRSGDKCLQPGDRAGEEPGLYDPELGLIGEQRFGLASHAGCDDDVIAIRAQSDFFDHAEIDVAQPNAGLIGLQAGRAVEPDGDLRSSFRQRIPGEPRGHAGGDQRDSPDQRYTSALLRPGANDRDGDFIAHVRRGGRTGAGMGSA